MDSSEHIHKMHVDSFVYPAHTLFIIIGRLLIPREKETKPKKRGRMMDTEYIRTIRI